MGSHSGSDGRPEKQIEVAQIQEEISPNAMADDAD